MPSRSAAEEQRAHIIIQLAKALEGGAPRVAIGPEMIEVDVEDLVTDTREFLGQASNRLYHRMLWPCVVVNKVDFIFGQPAPRFVPINFEDLATMGKDEERAAISRAREEGVPISERPIEQARDGFLQGAVDAILGRAKSIIAGLTKNPEVEIVTTPAGERILYSKGHFFSTARVFGNSDCKNRLPSQTYCFYKSSQTPHYGLDLWTIVSDIQIPL